jgi:hypothetical protein
MFRKREVYKCVKGCEKEIFVSGEGIVGRGEGYRTQHMSETVQAAGVV